MKKHSNEGTLKKEIKKRKGEIDEQLKELFELQEISVQPSLACNYGPGSSVCERGTCN